MPFCRLRKTMLWLFIDLCVLALVNIHDGNLDEGQTSNALEAQQEVEEVVYFKRRSKHYSTIEWRWDMGAVKMIGFPDDLKEFEPNLSMSFVEVIMMVFEAVTQLLREQNIEYFLAGQSLLGSLNYFNMIPWDDKTVIFINAKTTMKLLNVFDYGKKSLISRGVLLAMKTVKATNWKIFMDNKPNRIPNKLGFVRYWPFVDVMIYHENITHIWFGGKGYENSAWDKAKIFPLQRRPFEGSLQPVPCNSDYFLGYYTDHCTSSAWNSVKEMPKEEIVVDCRLLDPFIPRLVKYENPIDNTITEILILNSTVIDTFQRHKIHGC